MEQFLKLYPNKHIAIIRDNAPFHKSKKIKEQLRKDGAIESVHLIAMPPMYQMRTPLRKSGALPEQR